MVNSVGGQGSLKVFHSRLFIEIIRQRVLLVKKLHLQILLELLKFLQNVWGRTGIRLNPFTILHILQMGEFFVTSMRFQKKSKLLK